MLIVNNFIQPCLLCQEPVHTKGANFCNTCNIFTNKQALEQACETAGMSLAPEPAPEHNSNDDGITLYFSDNECDVIITNEEE